MARQTVLMEPGDCLKIEVRWRRTVVFFTVVLAENGELVVDRMEDGVITEIIYYRESTEE